MDNGDKFSSLSSLYERLLPALNTKVNELKREKLTVLPLDIWNYLLNSKWTNKKDLRIYEMVDDILNVDDLTIQLYARKNK